MEFSDLLNEIINKILFENLSVKNIQSCILTSKIFHVLNNYQKNIINDAKKGFSYSIGKGNLKSVQWIYSTLLPKCRKQLNILTAFWSSCSKGHLEIAKWIFQLAIENGEPINIYEHGNFVFTNSYENGHLKIIKWIYDISLKNNKPMDIHYKNNIGFYKSCELGYFEIVKWFYEQSVKNGKDIDLQKAFTSTFYTSDDNKMKISKWLYQLAINNGTHINIRASNDFVFRSSCAMNCLKACDWLCKLYSGYSYTFNDYDVIPIIN